MVDPATQSFYADRRDRGMTDAMIANELEASGWNFAEAKRAVADARGAYVRKPVAGTAVSEDYIEYDVPQEFHKQARWKFIIGIIFVIPVFFLEVYTENLSTGFSMYTLTFAACTLVVVGIFGWFGVTRKTPRRIQLSKGGYTILQPKSGFQPWSKYASYHFGLPEAKQTWFSRFFQMSPLLPDAPMVVLQPKKSRWTRSRDQVAVQLPYPPQERQAVEAFLQKFFPMVPTQKSAKLGWQHNPWIIVGLFFGIPSILMLLAVLFILR